MKKLFAKPVQPQIRQHNEHLRLFHIALQKGESDTLRELGKIIARELYVAARLARGKERELIFKRAEYFLVLSG